MGEVVAKQTNKRKVSREFEPRVRFLGGLTIYFKDKTTVLVQQGSTTLAFHRWWSRPKGYFARNWKPFCEALSRNRVLDLAEIRRLARKYDVELSAYHQPIGRLNGIRIINPRKRDEADRDESERKSEKAEARISSPKDKVGSKAENKGSEAENVGKVEGEAEGKKVEKSEITEENENEAEH